MPPIEQQHPVDRHVARPGHRILRHLQAGRDITTPIELVVPQDGQRVEVDLVAGEDDLLADRAPTRRARREQPVLTFPVCRVEIVLRDVERPRHAALRSE